MDYYQDISLIANSKEFRRLKDKTQLYNTTKGDHYRTRITHTIEVVSIALEVANNLRTKHKNMDINDSLLIAIALGHDIGHTPFGHVGERVLNDIVSGASTTISSFDTKTMQPVCFKHNINSFRIMLSKQFREYNQSKVLFSWKTLDGVLKHTKVYKNHDAYNKLPLPVQNDPYALNEMLNIICRDTNEKTIIEFLTDNKIENYIKLNNAITLEGQIVAIADEIAQRVADIDDIVRANCISDIITSLNNIKSTLFYKENRNLFNSMECKQFNSMEKVCKLIRNFLITEVRFDKTLNEESNAFYIKQSIYFSGDPSIKGMALAGEGYKINNHFANVVKKIIETGPVREHDEEATTIINNLFEKFYSNLYFLNNNGLNDILDDIIGYENRINNTKFVLRNYNKSKKFKLINILFLYCQEKIDIEHAKISINSKKIDDAHKSFFYNILEQNKTQVHNIIIRNICNYIASMTDSYAKRIEELPNI